MWCCRVCFPPYNLNANSMFTFSASGSFSWFGSFQHLLKWPIFSKHNLLKNAKLKKQKNKQTKKTESANRTSVYFVAEISTEVSRLTSTSLLKSSCATDVNTNTPLVPEHSVKIATCTATASSPQQFLWSYASSYVLWVWICGLAKMLTVHIAPLTNENALLSNSTFFWRVGKTSFVQ